jgi:hypothetical protein
VPDRRDHRRSSTPSTAEVIMAVRAPLPANTAIARTVAATAATIGACAALHRLGTTSGSTAQERRRALPGDDLITRPSLVTNHAATLDAPAERVWPWLTQVGRHRGGWHTPRWVDRGLVSPAWLDLTYRAAIVPADHVMTRHPFRGLAERVSA